VKHLCKWIKRLVQGKPSPICSKCKSEMYWREQRFSVACEDWGYWVCVSCERAEYEQKHGQSVSEKEVSSNAS